MAFWATRLSAVDRTRATGTGFTGQYPPPTPLPHEGQMIGDRVETKNAQFKTVLSFGLAMATTRIAAGFGE